MKIGFIGIGIMGAPMAGHLLDGGHEVYVMISIRYRKSLSIKEQNRFHLLKKQRNRERLLS